MTIRRLGVHALLVLGGVLATGCAIGGDPAVAKAEDEVQARDGLVPETAPPDILVLGNADNWPALTRVHYGVLRGLLDDPTLRDVKVVFVGDEALLHDAEAEWPRRDGQTIRSEWIRFSDAFASELASGRFSISDAPTDSNWVRDYFPLSVRRGDELRLVQFRYEDARMPHAAGAARTTARRLGYPVVESSLALEGGNVMVDDEGTLFTTTRVLERNQSKPKAAIEAELRQVLGVREVVWLEPLPRESTQHVDIFAKVVGHRRVLVSRSLSPERRSVLDRTARVFEARGFEVIRVESAEAETDHRALTYTNSLILQRTAFVPTYFDPDQVKLLDVVAGYESAVLACQEAHPFTQARTSETERSALHRVRARCTLETVLAEAERSGEQLDEGYADMIRAYEMDENARGVYERVGMRVVQVPALKMLEKGGAVHCLTMQVSK